MKEITNNNNKYPKRDIFQEVTDRIMRSLEKGVAPWIKPWAVDDAGIPTSATGRHYRGINKVVLGMAQAEEEYSSNVWFTRKMARDAGGWIGKGQKGTAVVFFKPIEESDQDESPEDEGIGVPAEPSSFSNLEENGGRKRRWFVRHYFVWNRDQIENLPKVARPEGGPRVTHDPESFTHELAERIVHGSGADIRYGGMAAFYSPQQDYIQIPDCELFKDPGGFHSTRFHELTHWTGHPSRLAREYGWHRASVEYAKEELVAEMGSAFFCDWCSIRSGLQHPEYINSWLTELEKDKSTIVVAATLAQKAFDLVFERAGINPELAPDTPVEERQAA